MNSKYYSPYNKTYQFICLQNQIAHARNKMSVQSLGHSNLSLNESHNQSRHTSLRAQVVRIIQPYRVIHRDQSVSKRIRKEQDKENAKLSKRLIEASCSVLTRDQTEKNYESHRQYQEIAQKYSQNRSRKDLLFLQKDSLTASIVRKLGGSNVDFFTLKDALKNSSVSACPPHREKRRRVIKLS